MRYCKRCVQPDTRPGIIFDADGVCPACRFSDLNKKVDWAARKEELKEVVEYCRKHNYSGYDCVVTVSGGKDSVRQSLYIRDELGLKPLLVSCSYPPEQITERGAHNISNLISLGFDCVIVSPNPQVWKILMREGFLRFGNWCKSTEMALYATGPRVAIAYHIPLIVYGENPALALGEMCKGYTLDGDGNTMKYSSFTLDGGKPDKLLTEDITSQDTIWYNYPEDEEIEWAKLRMIYLGYYLQDFSRFKNAEIAVAHGLVMRDDKPEDSGEVYGFECLDDDFVIVNQMLKFLKFGFGKTTEQVIEAMRWGKLNRAQAVELVSKYDGRCAERYIEAFSGYIGITVETFWEVAETFRNKDIWQKNDLGVWELKAKIE